MCYKHNQRLKIHQSSRQSFSDTIVENSSSVDPILYNQWLQLTQVVFSSMQKNSALSMTNAQPIKCELDSPTDVVDFDWLDLSLDDFECQTETEEPMTLPVMDVETLDVLMNLEYH